MFWCHCVAIESLRLTREFSVFPCTDSPPKITWLAKRSSLWNIATCIAISVQNIAHDVVQTFWQHPALAQIWQVSEIQSCGESSSLSKPLVWENTSNNVGLSKGDDVRRSTRNRAVSKRDAQYGSTTSMPGKMHGKWNANSQRSRKCVLKSCGKATVFKLNSYEYLLQF